MTQKLVKIQITQVFERDKIDENKKLINHLQQLLIIKLENWKEYKPITNQPKEHSD